jgi:hypothetical protein
MKTVNYNPSPLEVELAKAIIGLRPQLSKLLSTNEIIGIDNMIDKDNPMVILKLRDTDGDAHEVVLKIIQRPDTF